MENDVFTVGLYAKNKDNVRPNGSRLRELNVVSFDKVNSSITVKYGGAYTGEYKWQISSQQQG